VTADIILNYPEGWDDEEQRLAAAANPLNELAAHGVDLACALIGLRFLRRAEAG
jgi:hypothetical protein